MATRLNLVTLRHHTGLMAFTLEAPAYGLVDAACAVLTDFARPSAFTACATIITDAVRAHAEGAEADAGFDAGEWSGPAHGEMLALETQNALARYGFTEQSFTAEAERRGLRARWLNDHFPASL